MERDEDNYYVASVVELPGCHTQAKTLDKLSRRIKEAVEAYLSHLVSKHSDGRMTVVPRHGNEEIRRGLLRKIALDVDMPIEEFGRIVDD